MLEGFDGYYLGNRVICGGEETTIVGINRSNNLEYMTADGERHTAEDFERIPGYDYSKETTPEYRIGDYVRINVNSKVTYYGCIYFDKHSSIYKYNGLVTVVVDIMRDDHGTRYLLRDYYPNYIHGTALTAAVYPTNEVGDTVVYDGEKAIIVSKEDGMCTIEFDGETRTVSQFSILPLEEVSIKLERDVFGIGSMGDVIKGYKVLDNVCADSSIKCVSPQLFKGEYSMIEEG